VILGVIASVMTLAIVAFVIGYVCGKDVGRHQQRQADHDVCLTYATQARQHPQWRLVSATFALQRVAKLILGPETPTP
jgi:hypothetical protein